MAAVPATRTWVAGEVVTASLLNTYLRDVLNWLLAPAICRVRQTVAQSIPNNASTAITFDAEDVDSTGMHSTVSNTDRLTAVYPGWFGTGGGVGVAANTSNARVTQWDVNGSNINGADIQLAPSGSGVTIVPSRTILVYLNVGDYLRSKFFQNSGGALNTAAGTTNQPSADVKWESN